MKKFFIFLTSAILFASENPDQQDKFNVRLPSEEEKTWWEGRHMTGNWGLGRQVLEDAGVFFSSSFTTDTAGNPSGGRAQGFAYAGSYDLSLRVDFTKAGWSGLQFFTSAVWRTGTSLSMRKIDNQFPVQQVFGSQIVRLNELFLAQHLFDERFILKAGRLNAGEDFLASPLYGNFMNNSFDGNPISIFFNVPFSAYPNGTWAAYLMAQPLKRLSAKFGVYNANSKIGLNKYHGVNFTFKSTNGVIWITEWCGLVNQEKGDRGMPGNYKVGFFYLTGDVKRFTGGTESGDPCLYFLFDQLIYRRGGPGSQQGLTPFVSLIFQPKNRNLFPFFFNGGLVFQGPFASRPDDIASFGIAYGKYSSDKMEVDRREGNETQNFETDMELNYSVQVTPWIYIMPNFQYTIHPKGLDIPNAFTIGTEIGIDL